MIAPPITMIGTMAIIAKTVISPIAVAMHRCCTILRAGTGFQPIVRSYRTSRFRMLLPPGTTLAVLPSVSILRLLALSWLLLPEKLGQTFLDAFPYDRSDPLDAMECILYVLKLHSGHGCLSVNESVLVDICQKVFHLLVVVSLDIFVFGSVDQVSILGSFHILPPL